MALHELVEIFPIHAPSPLRVSGEPRDRALRKLKFSELSIVVIHPETGLGLADCHFGDRSDNPLLVDVLFLHGVSFLLVLLVPILYHKLSLTGG